MRTEKVYIVTTTEGCATNLMENATYRKTLELSDIQSVQTAEESNVIVINTCAYTTDQEDKSLSVIQAYQKKIPRQESHCRWMSH